MGEAVGQAGVGQDEVVRVEDFWLAEFGQQVEMVTEVLQLLVGFFRQETAGPAWHSLAHDGLLSYSRWKALRVRAQGVGFFEAQVIR